MAGTLTLRVITPDKIALDTQVESVTIPALDGTIGILPRHAPMVAALDFGLLKFTKDGRKSALFISGGFAEVHGETVRVVTEAGERPDEIDEARAKEAERRARERISAGRGTHGGDPIDLLRAENALRRSLMRLRAREFGGQ
jgi:F-type H+-transporting ATPase subunit epsilon